MKKYFALIASTVFLLITSCDDTESPVIPNEEELITTVQLLMVDESSSDSITYIWKDLDGDGPNSPDIISSPLKANTEYKGYLTLLNEAESPIEDITLEVEEEAEEHQLFYSTSGLATVQYDDSDSNGKPIGLSTIITTGEPTETLGSLIVTLLHEPNKSGDGVEDGIIDNAGGETDIMVSFPLEIQ